MDDTDEFNQETINTQAGGLHPAVAALDFGMIRWKMRHPTEGNGLSPREVAVAEREYRRFLTLIKLHPELNHVPSKLVDKFWHAHILDTAAYRQDCEKVFGFYLDHFPYYGIRGAADKEAMEQSFRCSNELYARHFGEAPPMAENRVASRCENHPCHAPTSCACRAPGACKN
jgi:hypothetical protein